MSVRVDGSDPVSYVVQNAAGIDALGGRVLVGAPAGVFPFETDGAPKPGCTEVSPVTAVAAQTPSMYVVSSPDGIQRWTGLGVGDSVSRSNVSAAASDGIQAYYAVQDGGAINVLSPEGVVVAKTTSVVALAVDADAVYWQPAPDGSGRRQIFRHARAGGPLGPAASVGPPGAYRGLAVGDACVFVRSAAVRGSKAGIRALPKK
jgi:hypothetical protein